MYDAGGAEVAVGSLAGMAGRLTPADARTERAPN